MAVTAIWFGTCISVIFMQAVAAAPAARVVRLLLVEDDPRDAGALRSMIGSSRSPRFDLAHVTTIEEACAHIVRGEVDLIVLDLGLPDASELEGLSRLRDCGATVPIVVLTGRDDESLALRALHEGAEDYLVKGGVDSSSLIRSIRYAIERHRGLQELARLTQELQRANATLEQLALVDPLTNLLNRRGLQQVLSREVRRLDREAEETMVLLVDMDDFKFVNDVFGHAVGDVALKETAIRLRSSVRAVDYIARIGGDEFMLILPDATTTVAAQIAERIRLSIATTTIQHSTGVVTMTTTIAVMMLTSETPSIDEVLASMHGMLRRAKSEGKNRVVYESGKFDDTERRRRLQADMCSNLSHGRCLVTVKQPIYRLADGEPVGYEFLSRYSSETHEMPDNFFRICSERNILTLVDHHCLRHAAAAATRLPQKIRSHVNLFPSTMINIPTEHLLESFIELPERSYCIEISEQQIIGDPSYLLDPVRALRDAGLLIAIDDVGFGNSCLESLVILEPDVIKIDKRCVVGLRRKREQLRRFERYIRVGRTFNAEVIVEGVETEEDLGVLRDLGVEYGQGFYWGLPS